jgi:hypothetical protein
MMMFQIDNEQDLLELAHSLGHPVPSRLNGPLIDNLIPLNKQDAHPQSLSAKFGVGGFPYHTDGAYFSIPPRFIVLRYIKGIEDPTPTTLCNLTDINGADKQLLKDAIWKVRSIKSFYSTILAQDSSFYRFDNCVMQPLNKANDNSAFFSDIVSNLSTQTINWEINKTIVINNWKYLHNRPEVKDEEVNYRTLQRIMIL